MSPAPDAVMRAWFEEVWNQGQESAIDRLFATDGVAHGLPGGDLFGPQAFRPVFVTFRGAFPDIHFDIERTVVQGDVVAVHCRVTGTHTGATLGAPTGRPIDFGGMVIARITDGQFREGWNCFDFLTMYQQIGLVPQF
jgi:predicted ester cyclase